MNSPEIVKVGVTSDLPESIESIRIQISVNTAPTATLTLVRESENRVTRILSSEAMQWIKAAQEKRLAGLNAPDVAINATDGRGGRWSMNGYKTAPIYEVSKAGAGHQVSVVDSVGVLDSLNLSIYDSNISGLRSSQFDSSDLPVSTDGDIGQLMMRMTRHLVGLYETALRAEPDPVKKQMIEIQHRINTSGALDVWYSLLARSDVRFASWSAAVSKRNNAIPHFLSQRLKSMLCQPTSGFWQNINTLLSSFYMFYQPPSVGFPSGRFMSNKFKTNETSGQLDLSVVNLNVMDGSARILPIGGVVMVGQETTGLRRSQFDAAEPSICALFPTEMKLGYIHKEPTPVWLINDTGTPILGSEIDEAVNNPTDRPKLSIRGMLERVEKSTKHAESTSSSRGDIMTEMCKLSYEDILLADSSISTRIPLKLDLVVGARHTLRLAGGGTAEGFISGVNHSISLIQGADLDTFSQVTITHVKF